MKTILFDLDGTIIDSGPGIKNCVRHAYKTLDIPAPGEEILRTFVGPPLRDSFVANAVPADLAQDAIDAFRAQYQLTGKFEVTPYPGIEEALEKLTNDGFSLYVATSKPEILAVDILGRLGLDKYFKLICGSTLDESRETKFEVIDYLFSLIPRDSTTIMVGDTHYDVTGALAHGVPTVGVSWGYGLEKEMVEAGAVAMAHSAQHLYEILSGDSLDGGLSNDI